MLARFAAIGQWAGQLTGAQLAELGLSRSVAPDASTFRKVLARLDAPVLDQLAGAFVWTRTQTAGGRRVIAIDGKTVRGARTATMAAPHLVSAFDHASGTVLGQLATAARSNEIPAVRTLLAGLDLTGVVVTADAMHTQTDTATAITGARGDYVFTVKANQPALYLACKKLPWRHVPGHSSVSTGHGRRVRRTIKVVAAPAWITFAGAAQVAQIRRTITRAGKKTVEVPYVITSADHRSAPPAVLAAWVRATGGSRTGPTGSVTSSTTRTAPGSAPAAHRRSWPPCATPPSACTAYPEPPASPPPCDITPPAPNDP